jgi:predicted SAM-dependent methyltransferase
LKRVIRLAVDLLNNVISWRRRQQRVDVPPSLEKVKVNLGCGLSVAPGWINIDGSLNALVAGLPASTHPWTYRLSGSRQFYSLCFYRQTLASNWFVHHNLKYGIPLATGVADFIFCSHFLEHLDREAGEKLLRECRRVLKRGGTLRIIVPDLEYAWELYRRDEKRKMLHDFFFVEEEAAFSRHRYAYDYAMLSSLMKTIGFSDVRRCEYRQGTTPDLETLDNRPEYSLYVEATA